MKMFSIDPGASGGIAYTDEDGIVRTMPMPEGMTEQIEAIQMLRANGHLKAIMENVGFHMPGNSATATAKFARHCGHLEAACYAYGISVQYVAPQKWQREIGTFSKDKRERKAQIKEAMARLYPHLTVTLKTADALGIFTWAKK
jgi:hypothetical protein